MELPKNHNLLKTGGIARKPVPINFTTTMLEGDEVRALFDEYGVVYDVRIEEDWFSGILIWLDSHRPHYCILDLYFPPNESGSAGSEYR
jgi:hypothetical protein